jgi:hypothetical protein
MRPRSSTGFFLSIAMRAIPAIGSQRNAESLSMTSRVRLLGEPRLRPPRRSPGLEPPPAMTDQWLFVARLATKGREVRSSALVSIGSFVERKTQPAVRSFARVMLIGISYENVARSARLRKDSLALPPVHEGLIEHG